MSLEIDPERRKELVRILFEDDAYKVIIDHTCRHGSSSAFEISIAYEPFLKVVFKDGRSFDETRSFVTNLQQYFVLCMGFFCELEAFKLKFEVGDEFVNCYGSFSRSPEPQKRQLREMPFPRRRICDNEHELMKNYLYAEDDFKEALALEASLIGKNWDMPIELEAIATSQCLEALSRIGVDLDSMDFEQYKQYVNTIKDSIKDKEVRSWISERMPRNTKGQERLLKELSSRYQTAFEWVVRNKEKYVETQVGVRNGLMHVRRTGFEDDWTGLYWHTQATLLISYFIIWEMLGLSSKEIIKAFQESYYMNYALSKVKL